MIYARLFRPTKSALRDFSHDVPGYVPRLEQRIPPSPRSLLDTSKFPSVRLAASYFLFFFSSFFFHASNFMPRLLYLSFTISTDGRGRREEKKKEREKISTIVTRQLLNAKGGGEIGVRSRNSFRLHQKIISVGARTKQPEGG